jgi:hypothetical protein
MFPVEEVTVSPQSISLNMLHLCIDYKDVTLSVNEDITRNKIPHFIGIIGVASFCGSFF